MKKIVILGSTGSIGTQALDVIKNNKERFQVVALTCGRNISLLREQIREFQPLLAVTEREEDAEILREEFKTSGLETAWGRDGLIKAAEFNCDMVLNALMGMRGLEPTYFAIKKGHDVALANKETLVAGGEVIRDALRQSVYLGSFKDGDCDGPGSGDDSIAFGVNIKSEEKGFDFAAHFNDPDAGRRPVRLLPVDSEHSAIFQCLEGNGGAACIKGYGAACLNSGSESSTGCNEDSSAYDGNHVNGGIADGNSGDRRIKKILLTCSGGPFRGYTREQLSRVTLAQALKHPKWNMGKKITIDSATLMNKGLEVIEAKWLFDVEASDIQVLIHPQSIVHSGVEYTDNSVITQMGVPDMRIPISLALGYPDRLENRDEGLDFFGAAADLTFEKPDTETFECLKLAFFAIGKGGSYPVVMNAANEELVELFLNEKISFIDIQNTLRETLMVHKGEYNLKLEDILRIDAETRKEIREKFI